MWFFNSYCRSKARLVGKTIVITGANCGIGKEAARDFYRRGARVILACRDMNKAKEAMDDIRINPSRNNGTGFDGEPGQLGICQLNLSSLSSVKDCAQHLLATESAIHILINNAGVFLHPFEKTEDGFETHFQVNYLGHFLLTLLLLPTIQKSAPTCRIINVSSVAYKRGDINFENLNMDDSYSAFKAYCQSKLANILFTKELANKLKESKINGINVYAVHPGVVKTELGRYMDSTIFRGARILIRTFVPFFKTAEQGAQTTIHCAVDESAEEETGLYYENCQVSATSGKACDPALAKLLWKRSFELLDLPSELTLEKMFKVNSPTR